MKSWRLYIIPGFVIVTILTVAALFLNLGRIESDLAERVDAVLVADGQSWATAEISGRTATIMGTAPTRIAQRFAIESADRVWGVATVVDGSGLLPLQPNFVWKAEKQGGKVVITGFVPSEDERVAILATAKRLLPEFGVEDQMQLARGQPVDFLGIVHFAIARLAELADGSVSLSGPQLTISGTARDETEFASAAEALSVALPPSAMLHNIRILPPRTERFAWRLDFDGRKAQMSGFVPSGSARADVLAALRATVADVEFEDSTQLASGAPESFGSAATFAAYQLAHLSEGSASMDGPTLSLSGKAKTVADYEQALAEIDARRGRSGGITFGTIDILPAAVDPYVWRAERSGDQVTLGGYVPTEAARAAVLAKARTLFEGLNIVDRLKVAEGDPKMDWIGAISFSLGQLSRLGRGAVSLTGHSYDIAGEALSTPAFHALQDELGKTLPASMELRHSAVAPAPISPFLFAAVRGNGRLTLSGYVPTDEVAKTIVGAAQPKFGDDAIDIRLELAGGVPDGFIDAVAAGLQAISRLEGGRLDLVDERLSVSGVAVSEPARTAIEAALRRDLPENFELAAAMIVAVGGDPLSGSDCQAALQAEMGHGQIQFDDARSAVSPDSYGLVDRLASIAQRCPAATIEVAGHTESGGGTRRNQALSEERAQSVIEHLVEDGVRRERLNAVGYGQTRPIASNSTTAGRTQNRRIEFSVVGQ
ncbi:OmpA family protein [Kaistia algarum]|uniref:OmpA family protein n=1 Tax=Kaistia algarum TaxID=2083279 RepID=UPI0014021B98|nr:OmpA family protein [Kaistia algarum]MCX5515170.1 OmpA family protein [Kaistia algarum]